ncbi:MAG: C40 family peptidase [Deltaproteobacteria bacterium]|nr:C40 family peptidase [Deltaproteobacteria bacterium]
MTLRRHIIFYSFLLLAIPLAAGADEVYKVRRGDSLARIAKKFHVKADRIIEANGLESDRLKPGDRLTIPMRNSSARSAKAAEAPAGANAPETCPHTVEKGETLSEIAEMYGMTIRELKALNHIRKPKRVKAGAKILVRKQKEEEPVVAAAPPPQDAPPAEIPRESLIARELREIAASPVVKEVRELTEPAKGTGLGGIKEKLISIAHKMLDIPYRFGGSSFLGIDCSGYVQKVFGVLDVVLPRTAREQFRHGEKVSRDELSVGDLVFFRTYAKFPSHVGIYLGNNQFIHASSRERKVKIDSMDAPYYYKRFIGGRRIPLQEQVDEI